MPEEDFVDPEFDNEFGDYDYVGEYLIEEQYGEFESMMEQLKHDVYNMVHFGHEDGPAAYAAELLAEEQLEQEIAEEYAWEDHLNPIQAFEKLKTFELEELGMYPDSHDRYEWFDLRSEALVDEFGPEPRSDDECTY
jgi:hypothetical protein